MKVTFITTVKHNVGDDFVREGLYHLLQQTIGDFQPLCIHKHFPASTRDGWEDLSRHPVVRTLCRCPGVSLERVSRLLDAVPLNPKRDKVFRCDALVQSGAPAYWLNRVSSAEANEWYRPLILRRWHSRSPRPPLLNLGAGTCQGYHSDGNEFAAAPATLTYVREFAELCSLTTVRDQLSEKVLRLAGVHAPRLPCPSIFARHWHQVESVEPEFVALNYMRGGGHYDFDATVNSALWEETFTGFIRRLIEREKVVLVCHNETEQTDARRLWPDLPIFYAHDSIEYLRFYARVRWGIFNRVHAAFALASFGRPAVVIGADSRAHMAAEIGLQHHFVNDVTVEMLMAEAERLNAEVGKVSAWMEDCLAATRKRYRQLLLAVLSAAGRSS